MRLSKIRVAKYEHSATSKWVVEGLKNNKGKRSRKFFRSRVEADDFAQNALQEQRQYGQKAKHLPHELRLSAIQCAEKLSVYGKSLEDASRRLGTGYGSYLRARLDNPHRAQPEWQLAQR